MKFKVYIGECISSKPNNVKTAIEPSDTYFPHGDVSEKGEVLTNVTRTNYFSSFEKAGTYFVDLFDIVDKNTISAEIHLNVFSVKRVLHGEKIITFFNTLQNMCAQKIDYTKLRDFNFMEEAK